MQNKTSKGNEGLSPKIYQSLPIASMEQFDELENNMNERSSKELVSIQVNKVFKLTKKINVTVDSLLTNPRPGW